MSLQPAADVPLLVASPNSQSERRVTPSWSLAHLKTRLEPVTGIPAACQKLTLRIGSQAPVPLEAANEDQTALSSFPLQPYAEIYVDDTRPAAARTDFTDVSSVEKYVMPPEEYETRKDSVLAWKKAQKLGRFDPNAPSIEEQKVKALEREVEERVAFVGPVPELPPPAGPWVGVTLDEPTGKNDGSAKGVRYFQCKANCGAFVRPEKVEVGDFPEIDEFAEEMEEI
ncbi:hypothetical protein SLS56_008790 [Neofusicoccum ribis]|uniref:CAP-Gly domain-containing protein n=1 Tax=Neofusicoccum ribis TaxID=45134 RepID=A0ABR3SJ49_9PEZI